MSVAEDDRGLHYGDGLFETIAVVDGRPRRLARHLARLAHGCARLGIPQPPGLTAEVSRACAGHARAVLKLIVTRGGGGRGYRPPAAPTPSVLLTRHAWPEHPAAWARDGVAVRWCTTTLAQQPLLAGLKHLNRLEQVLARAEWDDDARWQEGLVCDADGRVVEATQSNLFVVSGGALATPALDRCGVAGVTRGLLIDGARELGIACREAELDRATVEAADELLLCNSIAGVWPVRSLGPRAFTAPGRVTAALQHWLAQR